jgi:hypothetical protein
MGIDEGRTMKSLKSSIRYLGLALLAILAATTIIIACSGGGSSSDSSIGAAGDESQCPAAILELKQVDFHNTWQPSVTVRIFEYDLACPDVVFQDPSDIAWSQGSPGYDYDAHLLLPQGRYSACIDWWDDDDLTYYFNIYGDLPDRPLFELNENTDETVPPQISVSPDYPADGTGRCPAPIDVSSGDGGTGGTGGTGGSSGIDVYLIGNYGETAIYDPTSQQIADADITLSGGLNSLTISWKLQDVTTISMAGNNTTVYAIVGSLDGFGDRFTIDPPIAYGDYSIPNTEAAAASPAPNLVAGANYTISIATQNGESSYIGFIITN